MLPQQMCQMEALPLETPSSHPQNRIQEIHLSHNMFTSEGVPYLSLGDDGGWVDEGGHVWGVVWEIWMDKSWVIFC